MGHRDLEDDIHIHPCRCGTLGIRIVVLVDDFEICELHDDEVSPDVVQLELLS